MQHCYRGKETTLAGSEVEVDVDLNATGDHLLELGRLGAQRCSSSDGMGESIVGRTRLRSPRLRRRITEERIPSSVLEYGAENDAVLTYQSSSSA